MEWLNYHHLLYFWTVAREGSVSRASEKLRLAQPTLSGQIRLLEQALGEKLFARAGRGLSLTETGRVVYRYADRIFTLGQELLDTVAGRPAGGPPRLVVGVVDAVPKLMAYRILSAAREGVAAAHLVCHEGKPDRLLADLALHELDLVVSDTPAPPHVKVKAFSHRLGECGISLLAREDLARRYRKGFPDSLDGAPFVLPTESGTLRRELDRWFEERGIRPRIEGEFDDSALVKAFGQAGAGIFATSAPIEAEVRAMYGVALVGRIDEVREHFYAITTERRIRHPAILAIRAHAHTRLLPARPADETGG